METIQKELRFAELFELSLSQLPDNMIKSPMEGEACHGQNHELNADAHVTPASVKGEASDRHKDAREPLPDVIDGEADHEKGVPVAPSTIPAPEYDLHQLQRLNKHKEHLIDPEGQKVQWLFGLCSEFINACEGERLYHLVRTWDAQAVIKDLQADFHRFFAGQITEEWFEVNERQVQAQDYYTVALELLTLGIISHSNNNPRAPYHSLRPLFRREINYLNSVTNNVVHAFIDRETKRLEADIQMQDDQRCADMQSFSEHKEDDFDLAPAEKARVLMCALRARRDRGWLIIHSESEAYPSIPVLTSEIRSYLVFHKGDRERAEEFFEQHPMICVAQLMFLVEDSVQVFRDSPELETNDPLFHAKRGRIVAFLLKHAEKIAKELDARNGTHDSDMFDL